MPSASSSAPAKPSPYPDPTAATLMDASESASNDVPLVSPSPSRVVSDSALTAAASAVSDVVLADLVFTPSPLPAENPVISASPVLFSSPFLPRF